MKNNPEDPYITESRLKTILDERFAVFAEELSRRIIDEVSEILKDFMGHVDERFNRLEARMDSLETKVDRLETKVDAMGFANQARDAQVTRHERWHYQAANKLGMTFSPDI